MNAPTPPTRPDRPIRVATRMLQGHVHLGLDFGTHSTKAILRARGGGDALVTVLDEQTADYPAFCSPSLVRLTDGRLYFGSAALADNGGELFRSLKVSLLPHSAPSMRRSTRAAGVEPELLVALYLSWLLGRIRGALADVQEARFTANVAAPMNHLEDAELRDRYLRVIHAAWRSVFDPVPVVIRQGVPLATVRGQFQALLELPVPAPGARRFAVLPETLAPVVSLSRDASISRGFYMMLDVGAGTTELSVSFLNQLRPGDANQCIWCYEDQSHPLGADLFNDNDRRNAPSSDAHGTEEDGLRQQLLDHLNCVWYRGYQKDMNWSFASREQWRHLTVLLAGGGLRRAGLPRLIELNRPQDFAFPTGRKRYWVDWNRPCNLDYGESPPDDSSDNSASSAAYLVVADGLAVERGLWPRFLYPPEVPPLGDGRNPSDVTERGYSDSDVG